MHGCRLAGRRCLSCRGNGRSTTCAGELEWSLRPWPCAVIAKMGADHRGSLGRSITGPITHDSGTARLVTVVVADVAAGGRRWQRDAVGGGESTVDHRRCNTWQTLAILIGAAGADPHLLSSIVDAPRYGDSPRSHEMGSASLNGLLYFLFGIGHADTLWRGHRG